MVKLIRNSSIKKDGLVVVECPVLEHNNDVVKEL